MVKLNKIYTKTGDKGTTRLTSGDIVPKSDLRIDAYGTVDELNSFVGLATLEAAHNVKIEKILQAVQHDLFDLGADLSTPMAQNETPEQALRITQSQIDNLETWIDQHNDDLAPLKSFVLPNGTKLAVQLHLCRTITRRAERITVALATRDVGKINPHSIKYLNRLSDLFFVLSRYDNHHAGKGDILWLPAKNR